MWAADEAGCIVETVSAEEKYSISPQIRSPVLRVNQHYFLFHIIRHTKMSRWEKGRQETTLHLWRGTLGAVCGHINYFPIPGFEPTFVIMLVDDLMGYFKDPKAEEATVNIPLPLDSSPFGKFVNNWGAVPDLPPATSIATQ